MPIACDILLFVATKTEFEQLRIAALSLELKFDELQGELFTYYDLGRVGDTRVLATKTEIGPLSFGGSASKAIYAMTETEASGIISVGMAFGVDREVQSFGSIIVSKILLPYDKRTVITEDDKMRTLYNDVEPHESNPSLVRMLEKESQENSEWENKISFGAILSGAAKIKCKKFRDELVSSLSSKGEAIIGGEMEGVGMIATCERTAPTWIVVKGIVDFADENQAEDVIKTREVACRNSALFVLKSIMRAKP